MSRGIANPSVQLVQHGRCSEAQRQMMSFGVPVVILKEQQEKDKTSSPNNDEEHNWRDPIDDCCQTRNT